MLDAKKGIIPIDFNAVRQKVKDGVYDPASTGELAVTVAEKLKNMISAQKRAESFQASIHKQKIHHARNTCQDVFGSVLRRGRAPSCSSTMPSVRLKHPYKNKLQRTIIPPSPRSSTHTHSSKGFHSSQSENGLDDSHSDLSPMHSPSPSPHRATINGNVRSESFPSGGAMSPRNSGDSRWTMQLRDSERERLNSAGTRASSHPAESFARNRVDSERRHTRTRTVSNLESVVELEEESIRNEIRKMEQQLLLKRKKLERRIAKRESQVSSQMSELPGSRFSQASSCSDSDAQYGRAKNRNALSVYRPPAAHDHIVPKPTQIPRHFTGGITDSTMATSYSRSNEERGAAEFTDSNDYSPRLRGSHERGSVAAACERSDNYSRGGARNSYHDVRTSERAHRDHRKRFDSGVESDFSAGRLSGEDIEYQRTNRVAAMHHGRERSREDPSSGSASGSESDGPLSATGSYAFETPRKSENSVYNNRDGKPMTKMEKRRYERRLRKQRANRGVRYKSPRRKICKAQASEVMTPPTRARFKEDRYERPNDARGKRRSQRAQTQRNSYHNYHHLETIAQSPTDLVPPFPLNSRSRTSQKTRHSFYSAENLPRLTTMGTRPRHSSLKAPLACNEIQYFNIASPRQLTDDETKSYASMENAYECNFADLAY